MSENTLILDIECYRNFFYLGFKRCGDGRRVGYEFSDRADFDRDKVRLTMRRYQTIGFNSLNYDLPMLYLALDGASNSDLKDASDHIIRNRIPYWRAERELGIVIPKIDHIDLFETNPSVRKGLKALNGSMHHPRLQELPYEHTAVLDDEMKERVIEYCQLGDIDGAEMLLNVLQEPIQLREAMRDIYRTMDLRSKSDAQVGETIIKTEVERKLGGERVQRAIVPDRMTFRYEPPEWMTFESDMMQRAFDVICNTDIVVEDGAVNLPKAFEKLDIEFAGMKYTLGIGGLHSTEANRSVLSDDEFVLIDADVASQYPSIVMKLGLYPKALGPDFLDVYGGIIEKRLAAKRRGKEVAAEIAALEAQLAELEKKDG